jgi:hypothetical protein
MNFVLKTLLLLCTGLALQVVITGCCSNAEDPYVAVESFDYHFRERRMRIADTVHRAVSDTLTIALQPRIRFVAGNTAATNWLSPAYARCTGTGEAGIKTRPTAITITSNQDFIPDTLLAGAPLHELIRVNLNGNQNDLTIPELLEIYRSPATPFAFNQSLQINIRRRPRIRGLQHVFTIRFDMEDGTERIVETRPITW